MLVVVVTADRGLAGGFNANLLKLAQRFVNEHRDRELTFQLVGRKGRDYFRKRGAKIAGEYIDWITEAKAKETRVRRLQTAIEWMAQGKTRNWKYERKP